PTLSLCKVLPTSVKVLDRCARDFIFESFTASVQRFFEGTVVCNSDRVLNWCIECAIDNCLCENDPVLDFLVLDCSRVVTELDSSVTAIALKVDLVVAIEVVHSYQSID